MSNIRYSLNLQRNIKNILLCIVILGGIFLIISNVFMNTDIHTDNSFVTAIPGAASGGAIPMPLAAGQPSRDGEVSYVSISETMKNKNLSGSVVQRIQQRQNSSLIFRDAEDIERARVKNSIFMATNPDLVASQLSFLSQKQKTDGRNFIAYDMRTLESRVETDTIEIPLSEIGLTVKAIIDSVESINGMLRWSGHILDFQEEGRFTITHAIQDKYAVGTFETPLGNFSLEAKNGVGWVVNQNTDFFLPPDGDTMLGADAGHKGGNVP